MTQPPIDRRQVLQGAAAFALAPAAQADDGPPLPGPAMQAVLPATRSPGRAGDFDFLDGEWLIRNQRRRDGDVWDRFDGEATCRSLLAGAASIEELRIPARSFSGLGLRLLDRKEQRWQDHWIPGATGTVGVPGLPGSFENGAGIFEVEETEDGRTVRYRSVWDLITPRSCRWQQGTSRDGGRSWVLDWSMLWTRR